MTRTLSLAALLCLFATPVLAKDPCTAKVTGHREGQVIAGTVRHAVDGDGLCVSASGDPRTWVEIRLGDFDAPEFTTREGRKAYEILRRLTLGKQATCTVVRGRKGKLTNGDRVIATCQIEGRSLAQLLRRAGVREGGR